MRLPILRTTSAKPKRNSRKSCLTSDGLPTITSLVPLAPLDSKDEEEHLLKTTYDFIRHRL